MIEFITFFSGANQHVVCFHCGVSFFDWKSEDNAWEVHAKWNPKCHFLLLVKGAEFVQAVQKTMKVADFVDILMKQEPATVNLPII